MKDSTHFKKIKKYGMYGSSFLFLYLFFWILYVIVGNDLAVPSPTKVGNTVFDLLLNYETYKIILSTLFRLLVSVIFSFLIGGLLGIFAGYFKYFRFFISPIISIFRTVPLASLIILILLLTSRITSPYIVTGLMLIPIVYQALMEGVISIDKDLMDVWRLDSKINYLVLKKAIIPSIFPFIKTAFFQMIGLGFKVMIMAEFIAFVNNSIGKELISANQNIEPDKVFAWTLIIIILVLFVENLPKLIIFISGKFAKKYVIEEDNFKISI